jgi:MFS transporter, putative metabolite:H+ symporter
MKIERKELLSLFLNTSVLVASLGYFVDIYDLILFGIVRVPSLTSLGVQQNHLIDVGILLLNLQMAGMLIGGIIWGILGDKKGRISVLFASIFLYSLANIGNAFVTSINAYGALRFIAGLGLAGELGAAVTLVSELLPKEQRGYGTSIIAGIGVSGAIFAAIIGENFSWQTAYIMGGVLGFLLLILRLKMFESGIYKSIAEKKISKGNFLKLFTDRKRFIKYLNCILIGTPIWFVVGVLITFSPEFGRVLKVTGPVTAGNAILFTYAGLIFGDFISGFLSQWVKSRKKILTVFISLTFVLVPVYLFLRGLSPAQFYGLCVLLGFAIGYWAIFVTVAAENFGTNLRATVATTVPNFIRGSVIPITLGFEFFKNSLGIIYSALIVAVITVIIALISLNNLQETYGKDLDYIEDI